MRGSRSGSSGRADNGERPVTRLGRHALFMGIGVAALFALTAPLTEAHYGWGGMGWMHETDPLPKDLDPPSTILGSLDETDPLPKDLDPPSTILGSLESKPGVPVNEEITEVEVNQANFQTHGTMDIPTGAKPSPLFGATPFSQQMLLFEEFGPVPLGPSSSSVPGMPFPAPPNANSSPSGAQLDGFLAQYITPAQANPHPYPRRESNDVDQNPWRPQIETFLERTLLTPPAEGRPPGENWAHQRWLEFFPAVYYNTAQAGARPNGGLRDPLQRHHYSVGEFAPGGLYHNTTGVMGFNGTTSNIQVRLHPNMPIQNANNVWTWDGTLPPKLLQARYGEPVMMRHYNALPISPSANKGFGLHTLSTHEHNGHTPSESDGYAQSFFFPGQFYDYRWPMVIAGHDSINTTATDPRAGAPNGSGGITNLRGDWRETMSTHWFHDHMLDFTAQNVYKGNAAMKNIYSSLDRGNEAINDGVNLRFPSGTALDWGNRDYDVNLVVADKAWDANGQLFFNIFNLEGWMADQMTVNWLWKPYMDVRARKYRFRILNGSVSRYYRIALVQKIAGTSGAIKGPSGSNISYNLVPFHLIANDGNILEHAVAFDGAKTVNGYQNRKGILPSQGIAERFDIIVDFSQFAAGTKLYFVNLVEHQDGTTPNREISIASVLGGSYHGRTTEPADQPNLVSGKYATDPGVTRFLEFRVQAYSGSDLSMNPADYVEGKKKMIPLPGFTQAQLDNALHRTFEFGRRNGTDQAPWTIQTDGGEGFAADPRRLSAAPKTGATEIWRISGGHCGWSHPVHVHFEEGQILQRNGGAPPEWEKWARKDVYSIGCLNDQGRDIVMAIRFREFLGSYVEHCHNTQHEDHAMLLRWDIENPGQTVAMPTPMPSWDGVGYVDSFALPTARTGDGKGLNGGSSR